MSDSRPIEQVVALLGELDQCASEACAAVSRKRVTSRMPYRYQTVMQRYLEDGSVQDLRVFTRDLNMNGLGLLLTEQVPIGELAFVRLVLPNGRTELMKSKVVYCRHVQDDWHYVGLRFNREINPARYQPAAAA